MELVDLGGGGARKFLITSVVISLLFLKFTDFYNVFSNHVLNWVWIFENSVSELVLKSRGHLNAN